MTLPKPRRPGKKPTPPPPAPAAEGPHMIGYARVSMADQNPEMQIDALVKAGVSREDIYWEHASGTGIVKRRQLKAMLKDVQAGDVVVVWKLDRLGRNAAQLYDLTRQIQERGAHLRVLTTPGMDSATPMGRAMFGMLAVFAEFEAAIGKERTMAGLARARAEGRRGGRAQMHPDEVLIETAAKHGIGPGARHLGMSKAGFIKALARAKERQNVQ